MEANLRFKIDWASLIVGSKFTVFALFYFVFEGNFPRTSHWGAYIWKGDLTEGFLCYWFRGLIQGRAYFQIFYFILLALLSPWRMKDHSESLNQSKKLMCYVGGSTNLKSKSRKG